MHTLLATVVSVWRIMGLGVRVGSRETHFHFHIFLHDLTVKTEHTLRSLVI